jgi:hypothetical protein
MCSNKNANSITEAGSINVDDTLQQVEPDVLTTIQAAQPLCSDSTRRMQTNGLGVHIASPLPVTRCSTISGERMAELAARMT